MPRLKLRLSLRLSDIKTVLQLAQEGLKGAGFFPGVEAIVGVPLKLIEYCETVADNKDQLDQLAATLESLQKIVVEPIEAARRRRHQYVPEGEARLGELSETLLAMESTLAPLAHLGRLSGFRKREEISASLRAVNEGIKRAISQFQLGGQITVETRLWEQAAERLLATLHPAPARFDASEKQPCLPNTRSAVLATLRRRIRTSPQTFICLYGSPGTGKSAIAKSIATELHHQGLLASSYFFDKRGGDAGNISLATFVSTVVYQLARFSFDFHAALSRQLERDPLLADAAADVRLRHLLLEPLREVFSTRKPQRRWIIVLDALDECGDANHQRRLMSLLRSCVGLGPHVVFFLTCRPEAVITQVVQGSHVGPQSIVESLDSQNPANTTEDIRVFINSRLLDIKAAEGWTFSPSPEEISRLASLCGGLFEVAAIRLRQLAEYCLRSPLRRAFADVLRAAESPVPVIRPLHSVYRGILAAAYASPDDPWRRTEALSLHHALVGALAVLRRPLPITTLAALVGVEGDEARKALEPLSSVIAVPDDEPVHFYHSSFLEFLLSSPPQGHHSQDIAREYFINPISAHGALAKRTFIIMNTLLRRNILGLPNPSIGHYYNVAIPPPALTHHIPQHLRYACFYWAEHLWTDDLSIFSDLLVQWCNEKILFYLEVLSLLGNMGRAVPLLEIAERWIVKAENLAPTATLLNDCQRLVQMFYPAITESPRALYSSAIPLMPSCSLQERYNHLADGGVILFRGRLPAWPAQIWATDSPNTPHCVAFSPDGRHIASGCDDGSIRLLSATTGENEQQLKGHTGSVNSVCFSPDGVRIASASRDDLVRIWSTVTGEQSGVLRGHSGDVNSVAFSSDGARIVSGSDDHSARLWSTITGAQERVLKGHTDWVTSVAFTSDGARIAAGSFSRSVRIWSAVTGEQLQELKGHTGWVTSVAFSWDGVCLVSGSSDHSVRIWSTATGEQKRKLEGHTGWVNSVAFSPDGTRIASGSGDHSVHIWSTTTGERDTVLRGHTGSVDSVAFSPDGSRLVSASNGCSVRVWSVVTGELERVLDGHTDYVRSVAFSSDSARIVSGSDDCSVCVWSAITGERERVLRGPAEGVNSVAFSADGRGVMSEDFRGDIFMWDIETGTVLDRTQPIAQLDFAQSPRGQALKDGWLHFGDLSFWIPRYLQGNWWSAHGIVVLASKDSPGSLALIKLPFDRDSNSS